MKKMKIKITIFLTLTLHFVFLLLHPSSEALDVKRKVLENGLTLLMVERHNVPVVMVTVGIRAGNLFEPEEKAGLANLTAELLTSGTNKRTAYEISEGIEFVGASLDASGGDDYITVTLSVLKKDIDLGFDLLSDVILNPVFPEDELNKRKEHIKGGLKSEEEDPGFIAKREFKKAVFGTHPYGRLITGDSKTIDRIKRDDLRRFHSDYYIPGNAIMSVVGDITPREVSELLEKYFSAWQSKEPKTFSLPAIETRKGKKTIAIDRDLTQASIILGHEGISRDNPDYYAISVMNYVLGGGGFSSRLMQNVRDEKGLVYDIHSFFDANKYGGYFQVVLQTKNESANVAIEEVIKEIKNIQLNGISGTELLDAKTFLIGSFPMRIETNRRIADFLVAVEFYGLGIDYIDKYPRYIGSVTKEDILRVAKRYLDPDNYILVIVADQQKAGFKKE